MTVRFLIYNNIILNYIKKYNKYFYFSKILYIFALK